jgi:hypothetical protein
MEQVRDADAHPHSYIVDTRANLNWEKTKEEKK